jgi:hypothetical protein
MSPEMFDVLTPGDDAPAVGLPHARVFGDGPIEISKKKSQVSDRFHDISREY